MQQDNEITQPHKPRRRRVKLLILLIIIIALSAGGAGFYYFREKPIISRDITSKVNFALYIPTKNNPATLDKNSIQYIDADKVVTYNLHLPNGKNIAVSQMLKPADVEVNPEVKTPINLPTYQKEFKVGYGSARYDIWDGKKVISMLTIDNTWIVFNYSGVDETLAKDVASNLERIQF